MKIIRLFILVLISSVLAFGGQQAKSKNRGINKPKNVTDAVKIASPSIVQISAELEIPNPNNPSGRLNVTRVLGTGFLVSKDGYVATAKHVVTLPPNVILVDLLVGLPMPNKDSGIFMRGNFQVISSKIIAVDPNNDVALLKCEINPFTNKSKPIGVINGKEISNNSYTVFILDPNRPNEGLQIASSGYPFASSILVTSVGYLASAWEVNSDQLRSLDFQYPERGNVYLGDLRVNKGNSGGPVYSVETGYVIGVCVSYTNALVILPDQSGGGIPLIIEGKPATYNAGITHITPIQYVIRLLNQVKASYQATAIKQG